MQAMGDARCIDCKQAKEEGNIMSQTYQPARRSARVASGVLGAVMGLGLIVAVVDGMGARSGGQSLGQFMAQQRAIATNPVAQVRTAPATATAPVLPGA
jgi:hypothetical protein